MAGVAGGAGTSNTNTIVLDGTGVGNAVTGAITNGAGGGAVALVKSNASTWTLGATSSYSAGTTISGGTLVVGSLNPTVLGGQTVTLSGGTLQISPTAIYNLPASMGPAIRLTRIGNL